MVRIVGTFCALLGLTGIALRTESHTATKGPRLQVISDQSQGTVIRDVKILLARKLTKAQLIAAAERIRGDTRKQYGHTMVTYYLPGMETGDFGWAVVSFGPRTRLSMAGFSLEQEQALAQMTQGVTRRSSHVWGVWQREGWRPQRLIVHRVDDQIVLTRITVNLEVDSRAAIEEDIPGNFRTVDDELQFGVSADGTLWTEGEQAFSLQPVEPAKVTTARMR